MTSSTIARAAGWPRLRRGPSAPLLSSIVLLVSSLGCYYLVIVGRGGISSGAGGRRSLQAIASFSDPRSVESKEGGDDGGAAVNLEMGAVTDDWVALGGVRPDRKNTAAAAVAARPGGGSFPGTFFVNFVDYYEGISHWRVRESIFARARLARGSR